MSEPIYKIVTFGMIAPGKDKAVVMENMAQLFRTSPEIVAPYFTGGHMVIKSGVDRLTAEKYRSALENIGLLVNLEEAEQVPAFDTSGLTLAELGADVLEHPVEVEPRPIGDISGLTLAEPGADLLEYPVQAEPRPIGDISDISLAEAGADIIENPRPKEKLPLPDISVLSIADS